MDTTVQVSLITTVGLIVVAGIGVITARITSGARRDALASSVDASKSAEIAKDFAAALGAKDALIGAYGSRIEDLERADKHCKEELALVKETLVQREEEDEEQRRTASILERERSREISELREAVERIKAAHSGPDS